MATGLHTERYQRFSKALAAARHGAGLSQRELARKLGVDQSFIAKYEAGRRRLDVIEFLQILQAIGGDYRAILDPLINESSDKGRAPDQSQSDT